MTATVSFNPLLTSNASGSFNTTSNGFIQGQAQDDPSARYRLAGGILATTETLPMWGGVLISETTSPISALITAPNSALGGNITRATTQTQTATNGATGFSVFDQNYSSVTSPQSPVPLAASGMQVNFYRFGSNARIAVAIDPTLVNAEGVIITQQVSWDFVGQRLIQYSPAYAADTITGATWANTSGGQITYTVSSDPTGFLTAGDLVNVSGVVSTGATTDGYNGAYNVVSTDSTHIVVTAVRAASPGTYSSGGSVAAGGGALPCKVLHVNIGNSMTVSYDSATGFATWNRSGSAAIIQI